MAVHKRHVDNDDAVTLYRTPATQNILCVTTLRSAFCGLAEVEVWLHETSTTIGKPMLRCQS